MTFHGFRGNIKENNLKNSTLNMFKIQPYIDAIGLKGVLFTINKDVLMSQNGHILQPFIYVIV
jgi:hypothetical protein